MFSSLSFSSHKLQASKLDTISRSCVYEDFLTTYTTSVLPWVLLGMTVINSLIQVGINSTSNCQLIIDYMPSALDTEYKVVGEKALLWWNLHSSWGGKRQLKNAKIKQKVILCSLARRFHTIYTSTIHWNLCFLFHPYQNINNFFLQK